MGATCVLLDGLLPRLPVGRLTGWEEVSRDAFGSPLLRFIWIDMAFGDPGLIPECLSNVERINTGCLPPGQFVPNAMNFAVMHPTERDGELITCLAAEGPRLRVAQMVGVGGLPSANQASLAGHIAEMLFVAVAARLADNELGWRGLVCILIERGQRFTRFAVSLRRAECREF
jgi:hypothetical protein